MQGECCLIFFFHPPTETKRTSSKAVQTSTELQSSPNPYEKAAVKTELSRAPARADGAPQNRQCTPEQLLTLP